MSVEEKEAKTALIETSSKFPDTAASSPSNSVTSTNPCRSSFPETPTGVQLCKVCGDKASGKHYGVASCDGCRGFFKRSIRRNLDYVCKENNSCIVDLNRRNQCQACRFRKCCEVKMNRDAVQHERAPRSFPYRRPSSSTSPPFYTHHHSLPFRDGNEALFDTISPLLLAARNPLLRFSTNSLIHPTPQTIKCAIESPGPVMSSSKPNIFSSNTAFVPYKPRPTFPQPFDDATYEINQKAPWILFCFVKWAFTLPSFLQLPAEDQLTLLKNSCIELFTFTFAQTKTGAVDMGQQLFSTDQVKREASFFQGVISKINENRLDPTEFALLKAICLLRIEGNDVKDSSLIEAFQDQAQLLLAEHTAANKVRFGKLLLLLPLIRGMNPDAIVSVIERIYGKSVYVVIEEISQTCRQQ